MTTDGFTDQVGGERRRMYGKKNFGNLLRSFQGKPMSEQKELLDKAFYDYLGNEKQRDDVSVIGFRL
jgi:serine phosphatase RsbU (regulator of sigma subunit)